MCVFVTVMLFVTWNSVQRATLFWLYQAMLKPRCLTEMLTNYYSVQRVISTLLTWPAQRYFWCWLFTDGLTLLRHGIRSGIISAVDVIRISLRFMSLAALWSVSLVSILSVSHKWWHCWWSWVTFESISATASQKVSVYHLINKLNNKKSHMNYTVNHKKRVSLFLTITLANLNRFL